MFIYILELFEDYRSIKKIMGCNGPRKIKEYGREVENFNDGLWRAHCMYFVKEGNLAKVNIKYTK